MPTGLSLPERTNTGGGLQTSSGEEQDSAIITLALGDDSSDNPFQQLIGLGVVHIFDVNDTNIRPLILARLVPLFKKFEAQKRFKLRQETIRWDDNGEDELILSFKYINLETDEERDFRQSLRQNSGAR
jgi:hypothetical protein